MEQNMLQTEEMGVRKEVNEEREVGEEEEEDSHGTNLKGIKLTTELY